MKRPTVSRAVHGVGSPWSAWVPGPCGKPTSSTLLSALFEGPAWRAVHDGGPMGRGRCHLCHGVGPQRAPRLPVGRSRPFPFRRLACPQDHVTQSLSWVPVLFLPGRPVLLMLTLPWTRSRSLRHEGMRPLRERFVHLARHPHAVEEDRQLARHRHHRAPLGPLASPPGQLEPPHPQGRVRTEGA